MSDHITLAERAMIDAHIAKHGVTVCPPRTFSLATMDTWKELTDRSASVLRRNQRFDAAKKAAAEQPVAPKKKRPGIDLDAIARLIEDGKKIHEVAEALGVKRQGVVSRMKRAGLSVSAIRGECVKARKEGMA